MLTRLREIVEKVAMAAGLPEALELLVKETCQAMHTDVCSIYLADKQRRCFYLMATKGLKNPEGGLLAFHLMKVLLVKLDAFLSLLISQIFVSILVLNISSS